MGNKTRDQLKNLVVINAAIAEADKEIQMVQKEMNIHSYDKKYVSALNNLKEKIIYYRYQKVKICTELYDKIEALNDEQEKRLMKYRYIRGYRWEVIADKMGYSVRQVFNIHNKVLHDNI
jgi:DNA-directed RNA polymerase specialized sigma subunit